MEAPRSFEAQLEAIWDRHWSTTRDQIEQVVAALRAIDDGAIERANRDAAASQAHRLIGMAATFGRPRLAECARAAERLLRSDDRSDGVRADIIDVAEALDRMRTDQ